jgi:2-polyprenyl-3-methyl-5-hydroxy-6-metoxy-1,4-benzoquinol methylase
MLANRPLVDPEPPPTLSLQWEETACPLCGRDEAELRAESADPTPSMGVALRFAIVQCRHCGLTYTNPRPTERTIGRFYPGDYRPHAPRGKRPIRLPSPFWSRLFGRPCPERRGRLEWIGSGRLLDFGCGGGSYLRRMSELGWRVTGLDASAQAVEKVRDDLGCDVHLGTLPHPDLPPGSFDVITMWQSLEHVHRPRHVLRAAFELLRPGGKLIVAVPNIDGLPAGWFSENWFGLDLPRHLTHFTPATLSKMLLASGFRLESMRGLVHYHWLQASARRAGEAKSAGVLPRILQFRSIARVVAWGCYVLGRADCLVAVAERPA